MDDLWLLLLLLDLLEVQLRQHMQIVGQLDDEVQLVQEDHRMGRITDPQLVTVANVSFTQDHVQTPDQGHAVEDEQLRRVVETGQLQFAEVQTLGDFL